MNGPSNLPHPFPRPVGWSAVPMVSPVELSRLILLDPAPLLLDVRSEEERALARFPGDRHIPLSALPERVSELAAFASPLIVTYCHYGSVARRAAGLLGERGFSEVAALEGGIDEYARTVDPSIPRYSEEGMEPRLLFRQLPRAASGCLAYLLADPSSQEAVIIDPGHDVEPYLALLADGNLTLRAIIETHTHADHLAGHAALHIRTGAPIWVSHRSPALYPHRVLAEGDAVSFGPHALTVMETPGHTRDHVSLRIGERVFTGDTLLLGSCGRTDIGDGSPDLLWESLTEKLLRLPDETEVFPAHFGPQHALPHRYSSTIGFERATNEAIAQGSREGFLKYMTEGWPPKPADFDRIVAANLENA